MSKVKRGGLGKGVGALMGNNISPKQEKKIDITNEKEKKEIDVISEVDLVNEIKDKDKRVDKEKKVSKDRNIETNGEKYINITLIEPNINQPRKAFKKEELEELSESIKLYGVLQPLIVKKIGAKYEIIAGERRWRAAKNIGLKEVPVVIRDYDEQKSKEISIIENIQRENLNPIEEALAYKSLIEEYGLTQENLALKLSKNRATISNSLRLLKLDTYVQNLMIEEKLSAGHARVLITIEDIDLQRKIADDIVKNELSVREVEKLIKALRRKKKEKLEKLEDRDLSIFFKAYEEKIRQIMGTQVHINRKDRDKGRIEIEYYSSAELDRILELFNSIR